MDADLLRHIEYFSVPNNQTGNQADQRHVNLAELSPTTHRQSGNYWDPAETGVAETSSTAPTTLSIESYAQKSTAATSLSQNTSQRQASLYNQPRSRNAPPARSEPSREGHDKKRSKLNTDTSQLDSVDYWLDFDNDEGLLGNSDLDKRAQTMDPNKTQRAAQSQRSMNTMQSMGSGLGSNNLMRPEDIIDDSALDNALSEDEEDFSNINLADQMSKIDSMPPSEVPQREGLYSTPLSWEKPQPGLRLDSLIGMDSPSLNEAEQRRLIAIAMNPGPTMGGLGSNHLGSSHMGSGQFGSNQFVSSPFGSSQYGSNQFGSNQLGANFAGLGPTLGAGLNLGLPHMGQVTDSAPLPKPEPTSTPERPSLSRTDTGTSITDKGKEKFKPGDRTAHNDIERKYRTNLKDKIAELRDAVPALRTIPEGLIDDGESSSQPSRGPKVSKGTVLTKATDYIHYLEKRNRAILQQHQELSRRLQAFEQLLNATARPSFPMTNYSSALFDPRAFC